MSNIIGSMKGWSIPIVLLALIGVGGCGIQSDESFVDSREDSGVFVSSEALSSGTRSSEWGTNRQEMKVMPAPAMGAPVTEQPPKPDRNIGQAAINAPTLPSKKNIGPTGTEITGDQLAQLVVQRRIIVRTIDVSIEIRDIEIAIATIEGVAEHLGGWVVSSNRSRQHRGFISFRVPAGMLDQAIASVRELAVNVESENSTSKDVTDEYVDIQSRMTNLRATEEALIRLMKRSEKVEEALKVQQSLTVVQGDIEQLEGRIKYLEQTAAFSLVNVSLAQEPTEIWTSAGPDQRSGIGEPIRFRASFKPPQDIENFNYTWDFGDGSQVVTGNRTTPTDNESTRDTATVNHYYSDEKDSPYIVQFKITGFGEGGVIEGEDTLIVNVDRMPNIQVFAGERITIDSGEEIEFSGSFTRPPEMADVKFTWDFGDGSDPVKGLLLEGVTTAIATHTYPNHRPFPYTARLTITGLSSTGNIKGSNTVDVRVREKEGWVIAGWKIQDQGKTAVRTLSLVGAAIITAAMWLLIFSPIIAILIGLSILIVRRWPRKTNVQVEETESTSGSQKNS